MNADQQSTQALIDEFGWTKMHVRTVQGDPNSKILYTYTVCLDEAHPLPELVMFGLTQETINGVLRSVIQKAEAGFRWEGQPVQLHEILQGYPIELRAVHADAIPVMLDRNVSFRAATARPPLTEAVQIFWPGRDSKFPWDEGHVDSFADQWRLDVPRSEVT